VHVNSLEEAMVFYRDGLGFGGLFIIGAFGMGDVGLGYMPHAIAFNIWSGANARPAPADAAGLRFLVVEVPDRDALEAVRARLVRLNVATTPVEGGFEARDPSSNRVRVVARA
jgi:catechol 2,3-dioxygenase